MFWLKGINLEKTCNSSQKVRTLTAPNGSFYTWDNLPSRINEKNHDSYLRALSWLWRKKSPPLYFFTVYHLWVHLVPLLSPCFLCFRLFLIPFPVRQDRSDEQLDGWQVVQTLQSSLSTRVKNVSTPGTPRQYRNESKCQRGDDELKKPKCGRYSHWGGQNEVWNHFHCGL